MAFRPRSPTYEAKPLNPRGPERHFDAPQDGAMDVARCGYEVIDKARPREPFDPFGMLAARPKRDLGRPVTSDGPDFQWDTTTIGFYEP